MDYRISDLDRKDFGTNKIISVDNDVQFENSTIIFRGENNILFLEKNAKLSGAAIKFLGSNSIVYIGSSSSRKYSFKVNIYNDSVFYLGRNNSFNGLSPVFQLSEQKHIIIGDDNMFSFGITVRVADPHLIYNSDTYERINPSKSVFIGDHVWLGQNVSILKGVKIGSGSILAGECVVTKDVGSNTTVGGNPAKRIKSSIFWLRPSVHGFTKEDTLKWEKYERDNYIYEEGSENLFLLFEQKLDELNSVSDRLCFLEGITHDKNRFFC